MPRARFRFEVRGGFGALSTTHPEIEFRIVAHLPTATGLLVILDVPRSDPEAIDLSPLEADLDTGYERLHTDDERTVVQYELPFLPPPHRAVFASGNLIQFPLPVRNGWALADLTTSRERLARLAEAFEDVGVTYEIDVITESTEMEALLTDRQREFVTEAVERGYYDSPRGCTLTGLAAVLGVSKGAASGTLHRAERRIIKTFLGEPPL